MSEEEIERLDPVSWKEARSRLRVVLESYLKEPTHKSPPAVLTSHSQSKTTILTCFIEKDLDLYAGSLLLSVGLLALSCVCWLARTGVINNQVLKAEASVSVYKAQFAASVLILAGAVFSLWMLRSRRLLLSNDSENAKRRTIRSFLRKVDRYEETQIRDESLHKTVGADQLNLQGTSLTDIYPVYRISEMNDETVASWSRVPSLLLVQGDYIALQVGDTAPADCVLVDNVEEPVRFCVGDRVTSFHGIVSELPLGRTTLPVNSDNLLLLCNGMRVFVVTETPLVRFLRKPAAALVPSEASRQVLEVRKLLAIVALVCLTLTAFVIFVRSGAVDGDLSLILPLPFLAALGVLPVVSPTFLFFTEMIGTARILATVHKYSGTKVDSSETGRMSVKFRLLFRYVLATILSRLSLWQLFISISDMLPCFSPFHFNKDKLIRVPPASLCLLEKLGVATCFAVIDDQIVCEPHAIPQQLLIPSAKGLKLLDLCLAHDTDSDYESDDSDRNSSDSSENDASQSGQFLSVRRRRAFARKKLKRKVSKGESSYGEQSQSTDDSALGVQFEEPSWWQYLPTLKCIGLASLAIDDKKDLGTLLYEAGEPLRGHPNALSTARSRLVPYVCCERRCNQLRALAQCIGFSGERENGDFSPFTEKLRLHILSNVLFKKRLEIDTHERSSEQSRWWGLVRPDSTSVIVQDKRSHAYQLLTVGDPNVVVSLCHEAWQGEISTILPLTAGDRQTILETSNDWKLADLDVAAFAYSPVPQTSESRIDSDGADGVDSKKQVYLFDGALENAVSNAKNKATSQEWALVKNQVFLGVLGSLVVPRGEIRKLLSTFSDAGVRFVYFSPRNMRRQKELAVQMGIDVAWNAAISLRPLESGAEDPHRMVSTYADWDVNAKLPHGVDDVRKHLQEVDNVPLLVSLFTDATKQTTRDMVNIFQDYHDTVIVVGSTIPWNDEIFSTADIAIGIDIFDEHCQLSESATAPVVRASELEFVSGISAHSCAFRFRGASSVSHLSSVIQQSRGALEAVTTSSLFIVSGCLAFSFFVFLSACSPSTTIPFIPTLESFLFLLVVLPLIGFAICMTDAGRDAMKHVPPKNDQSVTFRRREGKTLYTILVLKSIPPSLSSAIMWLIAYGRLVFYFESAFVSTQCPDVERWVNVLRCDALKNYSGPARIQAGALALSHLVFCVIIGSASFVYRFSSISDQPPLACNHVWALSSLFCIILTALYLGLYADTEFKKALPWYYYVLSIVNPLLCLVWNELCKNVEIKAERRAEKFRRLQFETRLGAWSPK